MRGLDGRIRGITEAPEIHRKGPEADATVEWAFAPGDADVKQALALLHTALSAFGRMAGSDVITDVIRLDVV